MKRAVLAFQWFGALTICEKLIKLSFINNTACENVICLKGNLIAGGIDLSFLLILSVHLVACYFINSGPIFQYYLRNSLEIDIQSFPTALFRHFL